ncbi:predicted protein [Arabidopsis lyrata subsp. lyrata]|uniref:Predicted protein n=1 Tax=Arabidopsis lyrata subsp. lyrata TaxID=81972 RepID=D7MJ27_ARALL|nr:predicted protein [Arabidopsis lyrata subsp. lyrata]
MNLVEFSAGSENLHTSAATSWMSSYYSKVQHTSASLTINENYDPDVQADTETFLNRIVPEIWDHCSREAAICSNNILRLVFSMM